MSSTNISVTDHSPYALGPRGAKEPRYLQGEEIGGGAFGVVWKAVDLHDGKAMAVKRFHSLEGKRGYYALREINNLLKIHSPNQPEAVSIDRLSHILTFTLSPSS